LLDGFRHDLGEPKEVVQDEPHAENELVAHRISGAPSVFDRAKPGFGLLESVSVRSVVEEGE
jgi:hypothetical protein